MGNPGQALAVQSQQNGINQLIWNSYLTAQEGWTMNGNNTSDAWDGTSGSRMGTSSNQDLVFVTNSTHHETLSNQSNDAYNEIGSC